MIAKMIQVSLRVGFTHMHMQKDNLQLLWGVKSIVNLLKNEFETYCSLSVLLEYTNFIILILNPEI